MAKLLIEAGADPTAREGDSLGFLPYQKVRTSLGGNGDLRWVLFDAANPFHAAARKNDVEAMRAMVGDYDVTARDLSGRDTPACLAVHNDALEALIFLLEQGVDVNEDTRGKRSKERRTLADGALVRGSQRCLDYLMRRGGEVGVEWVMSAGSRVDSKVTILRALTELGCDLNCVDDCGCTPLHRAGNEDVVRFLLEQGLDVDRLSNDGQSPLQSACKSAREGAVKALLEAGAKVNLACEYETIESQVSRDIVSHGFTPVNQVDEPEIELRTALDFALEYPDGRERVIELLRAHGAQTAKELGVV